MKKNHNKKCNNSDQFKLPSSMAGQAIFMAMALVLLISVTVFLVFNSGRTVNEKINLVNAADAAAYSGAQIAARQLNFMAYTNRAMIANEVAIGHMLSFQMEIDIVTQSAGQAVDFLASLLAWFPILGNLLGEAADATNEVLDRLAQAGRIMTGLYATAVDSNNAFYSSLQYEAFRDFAYPQEDATLVEAAMKAVVRDYQVRQTAPIRLNDDSVLNYYAINGEGKVQDAAIAADNMHASFCQMMLFVRPDGGGTGSPGQGNQMARFCQNLADGESAESGSPNSPMSDNGEILGLLRSTVSDFGNAEWIRDRNSNYRFLGFNIRREGSTDIVYDGLTGQLNWVSAGDSLRVGDPLLNIALYNFSTSGNISDMSQDAADTLNAQTIDMLTQVGVCTLEEDDDPETLQCNDLITRRYNSIRRYAYLNPNAGTPVVTAFLSQQNCSDDVGVDDEGNKVDDWHDDMTHLGRHREFCNKTVYAVSQAQVFFQRPPCSGNNCEYGFTNRDASGLEFTEQANLFNPFWQVRLQ